MCVCVGDQIPNECNVYLPLKTHTYIRSLTHSLTHSLARSLAHICMYVCMYARTHARRMYPLLEPAFLRSAAASVMTLAPAASTRAVPAAPGEGVRGLFLFLSSTLLFPLFLFGLVCPVLNRVLLGPSSTMLLSLSHRLRASLGAATTAAAGIAIAYWCASNGDGLGLTSWAREALTSAAAGASSSSQCKAGLAEAALSPQVRAIRRRRRRPSSSSSSPS